MGKAAVFLDRDGVLNTLVFNPASGDHESPIVPAQLSMMPGVVAAARRLQDAGFALLIVSNQPNPAKGKATMEDTRAIADRIVSELLDGGVEILRSFYCY